MKLKLNTSHINRLFELTELHISWFKKFYSDSVPEFSYLLRRNHIILSHYCMIELYNHYTDIDIHHKLDKMFNAYNDLQKIMRFNLTHLSTSFQNNRIKKELL